MADVLSYAFFESPLGPMLVTGTHNCVRSIRFPTEKRAQTPPADAVEDAAPFADVFEQLTAYFDGRLTDFDLPLEQPGTDFQHSVWSELRRIPYGQTTSYGALAKQIGRPKASRAVGAANGANRLPIVVPCHRVIGADKSLTGFGGGLAVKQFLLDHERRHAPQTDRQGRLAI